MMMTKYSSEIVQEGDTSSASPMCDISKDTENNEEIIVEEGQNTVVYEWPNDESKIIKLFEELSEAIQNGNLESLQNSFNRLNASTKTLILLYYPPYYSPTKRRSERLICQAMFFDLKCLKYLLEQYEEIKSTIEEWMFPYQLTHFLTETMCPFRVHDLERGDKNVLHHLRGENALILLEYLSKCSVFDDLLNLQYERDEGVPTPLYNAIKCSEISVAIRMVELGACIDTPVRTSFKPKQPGSAIYEAVKFGQLSLIKTMLDIGKTEGEGDVISNERLYYGRSIFYPAILSGNKEVIEFLQGYVQNSTEFLSKEMKNENCKEFLQACIVENYLTDLLKFLLQLKDTSPQNQLPDSVFAEICMRAVELNNREVISMILESQYGYAAIKFSDTSGRTVLHHGSKDHELLEYLLETAHRIFNETNDMNEIINKTVENNCTALHYAAIAGDGKSVQTLARWSVRFNNQKKEEECDYILSCLTCEKCVKNVSLEAIKYAIESTRSVENSSLKITKDILFNILALNAKTNIIQYLFEIKVPGITKCDHNDSTVLHAAVHSGSLPTVKLILKHVPILLNVKDLNGRTPADIAVMQSQHDVLKHLFKVKVVDRLLDLNSMDWHSMDKDTIKIVVDEILKSYGRRGLTKILESNCLWASNPKTALPILNAYTWTDSYGNEYCDFSPLKLKYSYKRLRGPVVTSVMTYFVERGQDESLTHPLVRIFLDEQVNSFVLRRWFNLNLSFYLFFLILLTTYVGLYSQGSSSLNSQSRIVLTVFILLFCAINIIKELLQMRYSFKQYLTQDWLNNLLEWMLYICTFVFLLPINKTKSKSQIEAGAIAIFIAWINFIWFLKRTRVFGIYVILTKKVFFSLLKILPVVALFVIAFAMTFMLLRSNDYAFSTIPQSALTALIMMGGEIDYRDVFLESNSTVYIQSFFLILFFLVMSVVVMNVFVGLAVGDTDKMMNRSIVERRRCQAFLYIEFEKTLAKFPRFFESAFIDMEHRRRSTLSDTDEDENTQIETKIEDIIFELQKIKQNNKDDINQLKDDINQLKYTTDNVARLLEAALKEIAIKKNESE